MLTSLLPTTYLCKEAPAPVGFSHLLLWRLAIGGGRAHVEEEGGGAQRWLYLETFAGAAKERREIHVTKVNKGAPIIFNEDEVDPALYPAGFAGDLVQS